jgi:prenyltransferase beta subunit
MLQVARLAPRLLGESAELVAAFLRGQMNADGGFRNRAGDSDLYYSVFAVDALLALRAEIPFAAIVPYFQKCQADVQRMDLVHLACLARAWAATPPDLRSAPARDEILHRLAEFRSADGAFNAAPGASRGTLYGCFLATGACQDLGLAPPDPVAMLACIQGLRAADGGYANDLDMAMGLTPSTAAAVALLRQFGAPVPADLSRWLLARHHPSGGFFATPTAPVPDLLSTATALHALNALHADLSAVREPCLDFIDSLWTSRGAFYGTWEDDATDCEYAFYALLALGHLSL